VYLGGLGAFFVAARSAVSATASVAVAAVAAFTTTGDLSSNEPGLGHLILLQRVDWPRSSSPFTARNLG